MQMIAREEYEERMVRFQRNIAAAGLDAALVHSNESDFAYVRFLSEYWPTFETAGVFVPAEGTPILLIGPESENYARGRSVLANIEKMVEYRESADPEYPGIPVATFRDVVSKAMPGRTLRRLGLVGTTILPQLVYESLRHDLPEVELVKADHTLSPLRIVKSDAEIAEKIDQVKGLRFERIGHELKVDLLALAHDSGDPVRFEALVKTAARDADLPLILISDDTDLLFSAAELCGDRKPLVYPITDENVETAIPWLKKTGLPAGVKGDGLDAVISVTTRLKETGVDACLIDAGAGNMLDGLRDQTLIRRAALKKGFRALGYPAISFPCRMYQDKFEEALAISVLMTRYAGIVVTSLVEKEFIFPIQKVIDEIPSQITDFNKALSDHIRLIEYTITHDDELLPDGKETDHIGKKVEETIVEIENTKVYLQDTLHKIDSAATSALNLMAIYPFLKASMNMKQYIKAHRDTQRKSQINKAYSSVYKIVKQQFAKIVYGQSSGIIFTKSLFADSKIESTTEEMLGEYWKTHIAKNIYENLPFYYKHLFLRKQNYSIDFLVGREHEIAKANQYIMNYRNGFRKSLLIKGERHSGKSFIANVIIDRYFDREKAFFISPPEAGSTNYNDFTLSVRQSFDNDFSVERNLRSLESNSVVVIEDFELWWERIYQAESTAQKILDLARKYQNQITFIFIVNSLSFNIINKIIPMDSYFSSLIECGPMSSEKIGKMILTRHKIGNLKFELNGKNQDNFHTWNYAKLFNKYFTLSDGNPGLCLQMWINNIEDIQDKIIKIRTPKTLDNSIFEHLTQQQNMVLLNIIIHNSVNISKLIRIMSISKDTAKITLNNLVSMGLITNNSNNIYKLDRINHHRVVKYFKQNNIL